MIEIWYGQSHNSLIDLLDTRKCDFEYLGSPFWIVNVVDRSDNSIIVTNYIYKERSCYRIASGSLLTAAKKFYTSVSNTPIGVVCDCGAKHTSFPNQHYNWCVTKRS